MAPHDRRCVAGRGDWKVSMRVGKAARTSVLAAIIAAAPAFAQEAARSSVPVEAAVSDAAARTDEAAPSQAPDLAREIVKQPAPEALPAAVQDAPVAPPAEAPAVAAPESTPALAPAAAALRDALETRARAPVRAAPGQTPAAGVRREREAVAAFYAARAYAPIWIESGAPNAAALSALARLSRAREDGLDLSQHALVPPAGADLASLAAFEASLSHAVVAYARQASGGRMDPRSLSKFITATPDVASPAEALAKVAAAGAGAGDALADFNPAHEGYRALREKLADLRRRTSAPAVARIAPGPVLKIGMSDPRVPLVRARFGMDVSAETKGDALVYDTRVASRVAEFQRARGLPGDGALNARTVAALSEDESARMEADILANMERWRWLPRELGALRVEVNVPDFQLHVVRDGKVVHNARVIVGRPETQTPIFSDVMEYAVVNPYWNVPPSIIRKEMLPAHQKDPAYFSKRGYEVAQRGSQISVRQPPGERNALGHIKFMFPNDHAVYLHDTPTRGLFANARRAFSHGCVRVDQPFALAEVLQPQEWPQERLRKMIGRTERTLRLPEHIPVHLQYFTAFVDEQGDLQTREDLYGHSRKVQLALGL
jgi:murein L,D-transpeptidase YcbB/YkuD